MILNEGYNFASKTFGKDVVDELCSYGIPKNFIYTACRFFTEFKIPIEVLIDDFKKWNRYVLNNPQSKCDKNLNTYNTYIEFKQALQQSQQPPMVLCQFSI